MNLIRTIISVFFVILLGLSVAGWIWAEGQPSANMVSSRCVLGLCGVCSVGALWLLWKDKPV